MNETVSQGVWKLAQQLEEADAARGDLYRALLLSYYDDAELPNLMDQIRAYAIVSHYYPHMTDIKRKTRGGDKLAYQFLEEYLEGRLKTLDKGIIASMHVNNVTGRHNL